jgi:hypothetical protein
MDAELAAYDQAWNESPKEERNEICQRLADAYVLAHPELAARYDGLTIPELVALVTVAREQGNEERRIELDIWINYRFEFQQIGGAGDTNGQPIHVPPVVVEGIIRTPQEG